MLDLDIFWEIDEKEFQEKKSQDKKEDSTDLNSEVSFSVVRDFWKE